MVYSVRDLEFAIVVAGDLLVGGLVTWLHLLLNYSTTALTSDSEFREYLALNFN